LFVQISFRLFGHTWEITVKPYFPGMRKSIPFSCKWWDAASFADHGTVLYSNPFLF